MKRCLLLITAWMLIFAMNAQAQDSGSYLVIGAIGSGSTGVVLLKKKQNAAAFAVKVGTEVEKDLILYQVNDRYVYFKQGTEIVRVQIGNELERYGSAPAAAGVGSVSEIDIVGDKVTISAKYKDHLVKNELSKILMQAAAVPHYQNGQLEGFRMVEIDDGSIYAKVGLENGDIVTEINGQRLSDVGMTIKVLNSLREETRAEVRLIRSGLEKMLDINVK